MKHRIWYDEANGVLREKIIGSLDEDEVPEFLAKVDEIFKGMKQCHAVIDLSEATSQMYTSRGRKKLAEGSAKLGYNEKVAIVGASPRVKMLAKVLIAGARMFGKPIATRFFGSDDEALAWLREEVQKEGAKSAEA